VNATSRNIYALQSLPYNWGRFFFGGRDMATEVKQFMLERSLAFPEFGRLFGVCPRTAVYWSGGHKATPFAVRALMKAIQDGRVDIDWLKAEGERARAAT